MSSSNNPESSRPAAGPKIVSPKLTAYSLKTLLLKKIEAYQEEFEELRVQVDRNSMDFSQIERSNLLLKNKIQTLSLDLIKDMTQVTSWKISYPKVYHSDIELFLDFITSSRWLLHLFNSTESIYG